MTTNETKAVEYRAMRLSGSGMYSAGPGSGYLLHAVEGGQGDWCKALCGAEPGRLSSGWVNGDGREFTCPKCLKKIAKLAKV